MINRIAVLGLMFKRIQAFKDKHGGISTKLAIQLAYEELKDQLEVNVSKEDSLSKNVEEESEEE